MLNINYNPDVLSCLSNLSNDEVFTPPKLVNKMLDMLPQELFQNKETTFLDPVTKSGVFLREIAKRLNEGLKDQIQGFEEVKPMVFAGIYPVETSEFEDLRDAMEKLQLNDASLVWEPETSAALGFGFRCGFLGMLHMEIIQERLEREFNMTVITTVPNVSYIAYSTKGEELQVNNPSDLPDPSKLDSVEEPYIKATIITKSEFVGSVMTLAIEKRGELSNQVYLSADRVELTFEMPLAEIVFDFYDRLKSVSKGYASFDYYPSGMRQSNLKKMDIL
mgnify:CR=1 FL=1